MKHPSCNCISAMTSESERVRTNIPFDWENFLRKTREIRARSKPGPESLKDLINEGRKWL